MQISQSNNMEDVLSINTGIRVALVSILIGLLLYSFYGEKQPYNDGLGWFGMGWTLVLSNVQ